MSKFFTALLVLVPLAIVAHYVNISDLWVFFLSAGAIVPLAKFLGEATEQLASRTTPALGGLLNATFGNATELIIGFLALNAGLIEVVKASITGSIVGNLLLVMGAAFLIGGWRRSKQTFNKTAASASASTLFLAVIALLVPAVFAHTSSHISASTAQHLSVFVAVLMFVAYAAGLLFIFRTHRHLYTEEVGKFEADWSVKKSLAILAVTTGLVAWLSEILVNTIKPTLLHLGWTQLFVGAVIVAIIGNAAEHTSAIVMAARNRMDLALQIAIGSATQIALFVTPLLVFAGLVIHHDMNLIFGTFELAAIILSVMIANLVIADGESNWLEGAQLLGAYAIIAVAFFLYAA